MRKFFGLSASFILFGTAILCRLSGHINIALGLLMLMFTVAFMLED